MKFILHIERSLPLPPRYYFTHLYLFAHLVTRCRPTNTISNNYSILFTNSITFTVRQIITCTYGASTGLPRGFHGASTGLPRGFHGASTGLPRGFHGASTGLPRGFHGASTRLPRGFRGASAGLPRGFHGASTELPYR